MALFLPSARLLVLQVPGTASSSLEQAFLGVPGARFLEPKHGTLHELRWSEDRSEVERIACVVRNPFDMLHAEWLRSRTRWVLELHDPSSVGGWSLEKRLQIARACAFDFDAYIEWLLGEAYDAGEQISLYDHYARDCTVVFQMENLDSLTEWLSGVTEREIDLPEVNIQPNAAPYWKAYGPRARAIVAGVFADELGRYGYYF